MKKIQKLFLSAAMVVGMMGAFTVAAPTTTVSAAWPVVSEVTQTNATKNSISVTWAGTDCVNYNIYYKDVTNYDSDFKLAGQVDSTVNEYTINGLKAGKEYYVKVEGLSEDGNDDDSTLYDAVTLVDKISNLKQDTWYHWIEEASVEWDKLPAAEKYEYIIKNGKGKKVKSGTCDSYYLGFNVKNNQVYTFQVRAVQKYNGKTYYSSWNTIKVFEQPWITKAKLEKKKLKLKWAKQTGATGYDIYVATSNKNAKNYKKVKSVGKNTTSVTLSKFKGKKLTKKNYYVYIVSKTKLNGKTCYSGKVYCFKVNAGGFINGYIG